MRADGSIKCDGRMVFVGAAFVGEAGGLQACSKEICHLQRAPLRLSTLRARSRTTVTTAGGVAHVPGLGEATVKSP